MMTAYFRTGLMCAFLIGGAKAHESNQPDHAASTPPRSIRITTAPDGSVNPWNHLDFHNDPNAFQFAIVSDRTGSARVGVFEDAIGKLNLLQPEFVMSVGDLIQGYSEDTDIINQEWDELQGFIEKLEMPGALKDEFECATRTIPRIIEQQRTVV